VGFLNDLQRTGVVARLAGRDASAGPVTEASDPSGMVSIREALEKQLGLKLETRKRPEPVLVART
jgi:uncharacterized protein (TIGR03435 family)